MLSCTHLQFGASNLKLEWMKIELQRRTIIHHYRLQKLNQNLKCYIKLKMFLRGTFASSLDCRFLATGESFASLHYQYRLGKSTICQIVADTCEALWKNLQPAYLPEPNGQVWMTAAQGFLETANFPNCVGALDGKHVRIRKPAGSGSLYYNYKKYFSVILMAIADSKYRFLAVDIGAYGHNNDSRVFKESNLGRAFYSGNFNIPGPKALPGTTGPLLPHVLVADEAFQMSINLLKPYASRTLNDQRSIFNYRLSRARRHVECAFGILANRWRILTTCIQLKPQKVDSVIKACVVLHNFLIEHQPQDFTVMEDIDEAPMVGLQPLSQRSSVSVMQVRDAYTTYFCSPVGSVPWQDRV